MFADAYKGRRVLVTGHTGFKGSWLALWLLELGAEVAGFSLYIPSEPSHFQLLRLDNKIAHYTGDVRDLSALEAVIQEFKPSIVFHLAAQPIVRIAYESPKDTFDVNVGGTVNVLEALRRCESIDAAVIITSDKCYENVEWEYGYRENDRLGGRDPYSASKACAELAFSCYTRSFFHDSRPAIASARAGNVIGGGDWACSRIVPDTVRAWTAGNALRVRNILSTRPWQHVLEPLSGYLWLGARLADSEASLHGESFNFGPSCDADHTVEELLKELAATWQNARWEVDSVCPSSNKESGLLKLNCDKVRHRLAWVPTLDFQESARMTAEWYLDFQSNPRAAPPSIEQLLKYCELAKQRSRTWAIT